MSAFRLLPIVLTMLGVLCPTASAFGEPATFPGTTLPNATFPNTSGGLLRFDGTRPPHLTVSTSMFAFEDQAAPAPVAAVEYSPAYQRRAKIHKVASFAMVPLFVAEGWLGASIYNNPTPAKHDAHVAVATGIGALFAVNTVTGVWNLIESRHDPNGRGRRRLHGMLMLAADAGFLATALIAPGEDGSGSRTAHRAMAITAISTATVGYLVMIIGRH